MVIGAGISCGGDTWKVGVNWSGARGRRFDRQRRGAGLKDRDVQLMLDGFDPEGRRHGDNIAIRLSNRCITFEESDVSRCRRQTLARWARSKP